jgi:hypothetical protein
MPNFFQFLQLAECMTNHVTDLPNYCRMVLLTNEMILTSVNSYHWLKWFKSDKNQINDFSMNYGLKLSDFYFKGHFHLGSNWLPIEYNSE